MLTPWGVDMLRKGIETVEFMAAEIALVRASVPACVANFIVDRAFPSNEFLRDDSVRIFVPDKSVGLISVQSGRSRATT